MRTILLDPSLGGSRVGAKVGFDCTIPFGQRSSLEWMVPTPPKQVQTATRASVGDRLKERPATFYELVTATGTSDGREIVRVLDELSSKGRLIRSNDGRHMLDVK